MKFRVNVSTFLQLLVAFTVYRFFNFTVVYSLVVNTQQANRQSTSTKFSLSKSKRHLIEKVVFFVKHAVSRDIFKGRFSKTCPFACSLERFCSWTKQREKKLSFPTSSTPLL